ncbi:hypothetical protein BS78_06G102400 [Paspalum vaginatum]|nr:hypothetical protein BS78_06G102400 [Paspalum vaginatum]
MAPTSLWYTKPQRLPLHLCPPPLPPPVPPPCSPPLPPSPHHSPPPLSPYSPTPLPPSPYSPPLPPYSPPPPPSKHIVVIVVVPICGLLFLALLAGLVLFARRKRQRTEGECDALGISRALACASFV